VLSGPGTIPARQDAPHPHEAILDPTDSFIVVPDLGADLLRIFLIDPATSLLTESTPVQVTPGAGPRHGAFLVADDTTYFFLVDELDNLVRTFKVTSCTDLVTFEEVFEASTFGTVTPPGAAASEAYVTVSNYPSLLRLIHPKIHAKIK
jgi:6-phosphogluconolactonase (cycloisomerase 2 family)